MKILMVFTSKFHNTGITKVVMNYYNELVKNKDLQIDFVVPNKVDSELAKPIRNNNGNIYVLPMKIRRLLPLIYYFKLKKIIKKEKYDIVHVHGSSAIMALELLIAKHAGVKTRIAHSHNTVTEHRILHRLFKRVFDNNYTDAFACGKEAGKWLFGEREFYIVKNAQDIEKFTFSEEQRKRYRKKYNLENSIVLGHVGAFNFQKNHDFLIDMFNELHKQDKRYRLVLIGTGPLYDEIKKKVSSYCLDTAVLFVGNTPKVNEWLNAMDIMLLPSRYEGLPNVLIEWQISGLPCVISSTITKEVQLTKLIFFEELNSNKWINRINTISSNIPKKRIYKSDIEKIKKAGYDIKNNARELYYVYKRIINEKE